MAVLRVGGPAPVVEAECSRYCVVFHRSISGGTNSAFARRCEPIPFADCCALGVVCVSP